MHVDWCPSASAVSDTPVEPGEEVVQQKPVNILLLWNLLRAAPDKNVWPLHSQSACSQVSAVLFYARTAKFVRTQTCDGDMRVSLLQAKVWQHHLSQNIGYTIAGSARPAPPALSERNECVKETVLLKVQRSNFKSLWKKWGGPSHPSCPSRLSHSTSDGLDKGW